MLQSNLLIFQYAIRHGLTTRAFTELLQLLSVHLPQNASIPKSVYSLMRLFVEAFPKAQAVKHFYCSFCLRPLQSSTERCTGNGCGGTNSITIPLGKRMMKGVCIKVLNTDGVALYRSSVFRFGQSRLSLMNYLQQ